MKSNAVMSDPAPPLRSRIRSQFGSRSRSRSDSEVKYQKIVRQVHLDEYECIPWSNDDLIPFGDDDLLQPGMVEDESAFIENILNELMRCKQRIDECTFNESRRFKVFPELAHILPLTT